MTTQSELDLGVLAERLADLLRPHLEPKPARLGWSPGEAADLIGIDPSTCYRWIDQGIIPATKLGGRLIVSDAALRALLEKRRA